MDPTSESKHGVDEEDDGEDLEEGKATFLP
jgi:hypothetical protein